MQKVVRRAALARNQAQRKAKNLAEKNRHEQWKSRFQEKTQFNKSVLEEVKQEKLTRREDWMRGPLAPKRDSGSRLGTYGTISAQRMHLPKVYEDEKKKFLNIVLGDRVCLMKGRDKGKIGKVSNVDRESESVTVEGLNMYDVEFPEFAIANEPDKRPFRSISIPVPLDDVRLVVPLDDPESGGVKDVLVKHLHGAGPFLEQEYGSITPRHTRYITGPDIEIPWPETDMREDKDEEVDTLRIDVEAQTYMPSITEAPFPLTVIDELRNKFSKFRERHDPEWLADKQRDDAHKEWQQSRKLFTPKTEFYEQQIAQKRREAEAMKDATGNATISQETASFIEQFMSSQGMQPRGQKKRNKNKETAEADD